MPDKIDHKLLDKFLGHVLDRYKSGDVDRSRAIGAIAHLVAAVDLPEEAGPSDPSDYMNAVLDGDLDD